MTASKEKVKTTMSLDSELDKQLRIIAAKHRRPFSDIASEALRYCLENRSFLGKLEQKYTKAIEIEY